MDSQTDRLHKQTKENQMNTNKKNTMMLAASEQGSGLLEVLIIIGLLALAYAIVSKFLSILDGSACGILEQCK